MAAEARILRLASLLAWICVAAAGSGDLTAQPPPANQSSPPVNPSTPTVSVADALDLLWESVSRTVSSSTGAACRDVQTQLASVQTQLQSELQSRLTAVQTGVESRLQSVQTGLQSEVQSRLTAVQTGVESRLQSVQTGLQSELASLQSALLPPRDCSDLPEDASSGVHLLRPGSGRPVPALCDLTADGGGWTVFQRRADIQPREDFFRGWHDYKWGFGELDGEFWWGLKRLADMTSLLDRRYELRINMEDFDGGRRHATYQGFRISHEEDGYRLTVSNYSGDAGDNFGQLSGVRFSTKDRDQDTYSGNCATAYKGGWWYTKCHSSNLNGLYLSGNHDSYADGINWHAWRGHHYSLKNVEMKIRPSKKL